MGAFRRHSSGRNVMKVEDMLRMCSTYQGSRLTGERLANLFTEGERGEGSQRDKLARLFKLCDGDRDGYISGQDLTETLAAWSRQTDDHSQLRQLIFTRENSNICEEQFIKQCELLISDQAIQVLL